MKKANRLRGLRDRMQTRRVPARKPLSGLASIGLSTQAATVLGVFGVAAVLVLIKKKKEKKKPEVAVLASPTTQTEIEVKRKPPIRFIVQK